MADASQSYDPGRGQISWGPTDSLADRTLDFVSAELAIWRDDPERKAEDAEEHLNSQLCKYLNVAASERFPMVLFSHEEKQTGTRRVDISAVPKSGFFVGQMYHSIYDPFLVLEGKRLPAPGAAREREYVTGGTNKSGGIQRFKLALHGARQTTAAIIGYVQADTFAQWLSRINLWIASEAENNTVSGEDWSLSEQLMDFREVPSLRIAASRSVHARIASAASPEIHLRHLWVTMSR